MAASIRQRVLSQSIRFTCCLSKSYSLAVHANRSLYISRNISALSGANIKEKGWQPDHRMSWKSRMMSTEANPEKEEEEEFRPIMKNEERSKGPADKHEFQAETRKLLDIVAHSLYSEKEVFIRELISNSSDALEKLRYVQVTDETPEQNLEIQIVADEDKKTFTIHDTGIGMTKEELISNLGIIARSGSKAFLESVDNSKGSVDKKIIGQFGVGFYSAFMVGDKIEVFTKSQKPGSTAYKWTSDGLGSYEIAEAEGVDVGTKIIIHLKGDCYDYAKEDKIKDVIKKYSNFVGVPIFLNGKKVNVIQALWTMEQRDITEDMHEEFYRFIANAYDRPRYYLHYKADAPINIRALFYVPEYKPTMFDLSRETDSSMTLYSRKVMIMAKANNILPKWLRFVKGVVDSEDIPLNLSRELLQDSGLIRKLRWVLTNRLLKYFAERAKKDNEKYLEFYNDYGMFFREGIVTTPDQSEREEIAKLLRFESSKTDPGVMTSLEEYSSRMKAGTRDIYYVNAPSRHLAETSPYMEAMKSKDVEVLFCFEPYDELVLMNLAQWQKKNLKSIENEMVEDKSDNSKIESEAEGSLTQEEADDLNGWLQVTLGNKVNKVRVTNKLASHPCVVTVTEMGAARHFLKTTMADRSEEERYRLLQPTLEINPQHDIIRQLHKLKSGDPDLARLVAEQIFDNAMIAAGLIDDPRTMLNRMNDLLSKALAKH